MAADQSDVNVPEGIPDPIWDALTTEPSTGVSVVTSDGWLLYINEQGARIFMGDDATPEEFMGRPWRDFMPADWVKERLELLDQMRSDHRPVLMRVIWNGFQHFTWVYPIPVDEAVAGAAHFLTITRRMSSSATLEEHAGEGFELVNSNVLRLGPLDVLTARELEVLALLGQGLSIADIAKLLHRSPKTVDGHRTSIGRKLREHKGVRLAEIARTAGLSIDDAERERV